MHIVKKWIYRKNNDCFHYDFLVETVSLIDLLLQLEWNSLAMHSLWALHLSWWFTISNLKLEFPSAKDVRISGISPLHFLQYLQYIIFCFSSNWSQRYDSSQLVLKRLPFLPIFCLFKSRHLGIELENRAGHSCVVGILNSCGNGNGTLE